MASSLASQLAGIRSVNAKRLASASALTSQASYLFPPRVAAQQDTATLHALGINGWDELCAQDASLANWEEAVSLFGEQSRDADRTLLTKEENTNIDAKVRVFLARVGPVLLGKSTAKCLEWLIRRFRIHEFSVMDLLGAFFPYHETAQFARILQICNVESTRTLAFLLPVQKRNATLPSSLLISELLAPPATSSSSDLLRWICSLVLLKRSSVLGDREVIQPHPALVSFWASTMTKVCVRLAGAEPDDLGGNFSSSASRGQRRKQGDALYEEHQAIASIILPSAVGLLGSQTVEVMTGLDLQLAGLVVVAAASVTFDLSADTARSILASVASSAKRTSNATLQKTLKQNALHAALYACSSVCSGSSGEADDSVLNSEAGPGQRFISSAALQDFLDIPSFVSELQVITQRFDTSKFLAHVVASLAVDIANPRSATTLGDLLLASIPDTLVRDAAQLLISIPMPAQALSADKEEVITPAGIAAVQVSATHKSRIEILHRLRQQKPQLLDAAIQTFTKTESSAAGDDESHSWRVLRAVIEQGSGSVGGTDESASNDGALWLGIHDAEPGARCIALNQLFEALEQRRIATSDPFVQDALLARIADIDITVIDVLYSQQSRIIQSLPQQTLLDALLRAASPSRDVPRSIIRAHLRFLFTSALSSIDTGDETIFRIFTQLLWPRLLWTKGSRKTAEMTAHLLVEAESEGGAAWTGANVIGPLTVGARRAVLEKDIVAADANSAIAQSIAVELARLAKTEVKCYEKLVTFVILQAGIPSPGKTQQVSDGTPAGRALALLVLNEHLPSIRKDARLYAALVKRVLPLLDFLSTGTSSDHDNQESTSISDVDSVSKATHDLVYSRPCSVRTTRWLTIHLLHQLVAGLRLQIDSTGSFLGPRSNEASETSAVLVRAYAVANSPVLGSTQSRKLLRTIFAALREHTLSFLAAIWTGCISPETTSGESNVDGVDFAARLAALVHAQVFIASFDSSTGDADRIPQDFQVVIPALLIALADSEDAVRAVALKCIATVADVAKQAKSKSKNAPVWGFDAFYGESSSSIQYLDVSTTIKYAEQLASAAESFKHDQHYLAPLHQALLNVDRRDGREAINFKHGVVCYLSSHISCWPSMSARKVLLDSVRDVHDASKLEIVLPLVRNMLARKGTNAVTSLEEHYCAVLLATFDTSTVSFLEDQSNGSWKLYMKALAHQDPLVQRYACASVNGGLFAALGSDKRRECFLHLATVLADPNRTSAPEVHRCIRGLDADVTVLAPALMQLREAVIRSVDVESSAKRPRTANDDNVQLQQSTGALVSALEAVLSSRSQVSGALVGELFEIMRLGVERSGTTQFNSEYIIQLSVGCLSKLLDQTATPLPEVVESLRVDTIVNVIKVSTDPQTSQQTLLLLARVATLAPESVLHNVMPIFTFVGSTILQRDDSYSFLIVERTIRSILPPLIASLRKNSASASDHFSLLLESRAFLRIFTDAATHVPRHRRQTFFRLLVEVLGPQDFLSGVCMLLVDRVAYKVTKQPQEDVNATLQLALSNLQPYNAAQQLVALDQIWEEASRLWENRNREPTEVDQSVFLDRVEHLDREHSDKKADPSRQISALLTFITSAVQSHTFEVRARAEVAKGRIGSIQRGFEAFIQHALDMSCLSDEGIAERARLALNAVSALAPPSTLLRVITTLVGGVDPLKLQSGLDLFAMRVIDMNADDRASVSSAVPLVIETAQTILRQSSESEPLQLSALKSIQNTVTTSLPSEHGPLSNTLVDLMAVGRRTDCSLPVRLAAVRTLRQLSTVLGPRLIPHIAAIGPFCLAIATPSVKPAPISLREVALQTLASLFVSVPLFMSSLLPPIFILTSSPAVVEESGHRGIAKAFNPLYGALIKNTSTQELFDALVATWDKTDKHAAASYVTLLDVLQRILRHANRDAVGAMYKSVFRFILRVLDMRRVNAGVLQDDEQHQVEDRCLSAFVRLVLKLNESTFRPLFLRIFDWAALDLADDDLPIEDAGLCARRLVLFKTTNALLNELQSLVAPYYATLLDHAVDLLRAFQDGKIGLQAQGALWIALVTSLQKSAEYDENAVWSPARFGKIAPVLIAQLRLIAAEDADEQDVPVASAVQGALCALAQIVPDDASLKLANSTLLVLTRAEDVVTSVAALSVARSLWHDVGEPMLGLVPETTPFLAELLDSQHNLVLEGAQALVRQVEEVLGEPLDEYL